MEQASDHSYKTLRCHNYFYRFTDHTDKHEHKRCSFNGKGIRYVNFYGDLSYDPPLRSNILSAAMVIDKWEI